MSKTIYASAAALAATVLLAACGSSSSTSSSSSTAAATPAASSSSGSSATSTVKTASNPKVGATILTDASGMTLYRLSGESAGKFICSSQACLAIWHPLKAGAGAAPSGASGLSTVKRPDGSEQVAYQGGPLYTFASDKAPGQTAGQGIKDVGTWGVVVVGGASSAPASSPAPAAPSEEGSSKGGGGGYAY
jgi:predicted lipoprotein with Yx(FWY)xxD motif